MYTGPETTLGISAKGFQKVTWGWTSIKQGECWLSICGNSQPKGSLKRPSAKRAGELLSLRILSLKKTSI
jgi:hypothetical protein